MQEARRQQPEMEIKMIISSKAPTRSASLLVMKNQLSDEFLELLVLLSQLLDFRTGRVGVFGLLAEPGANSLPCDEVGLGGIRNAHAFILDCRNDLRPLLGTDVSGHTE